MLRISFCLVCALLFVSAIFITSSPTARCEEQPAIVELVKIFLAEKNIEKAIKIADEIAILNPSAEEVEKLLVKGADYSGDVVKGWQVVNFACPDGVERPYHLYIPENYDTSKKHPLIFDLHGGVTSPKLVPVETLASRRNHLGPMAAENGFIIVIPHGQKGAEWWSRNGFKNLFAQLREIKLKYNVDENRVFTTGFSDGGSGSWVYPFLLPTRFAGFVAFSGHPYVAAYSDSQVYPRNLRSRPIYAVNGGKDPISPASGIKPMVELFQNAGAIIDWKVYPDSGHDSSYMKAELPRAIEFFKSTARNPFSKNIVWETSDATYGRLDWVAIDNISDVGNNMGFENDFNLPSQARRPVLGVEIDNTFSGAGVKIDSVSPGSIADKSGVKQGDIIVAIGSAEIKNLSNLQEALQNIQTGADVVIKLTRGDAPVEVTVRFEEQKQSMIFSRAKMTASIEVTASGNEIEVRARNVAVFTLYLSRKMFDLSQPIKVSVNGKEVYNAITLPDPVFMLKQFAKDYDRTMVFPSKIEITVPTGK